VLWALAGMAFLALTALFAGIALFGTGAVGGNDPPPGYAGAALGVAVGVAVQWLLWRARRFVGRRLDWIG